MSGERPTAILSVGEHEVQHESTDCCEQQLPRAAVRPCSERSNRIGQKTVEKEAFCTDSAKSPVTGSVPRFKVSDSL